MHCLTAMLLDPLRLTGSAVGFRGRLIADWEITGFLAISRSRNFSRLLAPPRSPNWSRLGGGDFQALPLGNASVVKKRAGFLSPPRAPPDKQCYHGIALGGRGAPCSFLSCRFVPSLVLRCCSARSVCPLPNPSSILVRGANSSSTSS